MPLAVPFPDVTPIGGAHAPVAAGGPGASARDQRTRW